MAHFRPISRHFVFPVERKGDTLIITPAGDAGSYAGIDVQGELNQVLRLYDNPRLKNAIVDLSGSNYFGSEIVGAMNCLGSHVRERGGRFAVCEASPDMRAGLHIMKLDTLWPLYDGRREAENAIVTQTWGEWIHANLGVIAMTAAIVLAAILAAWWLWGRN